jgi:hypothetical protein
MEEYMWGIQLGEHLLLDYKRIHVINDVGVAIKIKVFFFFFFWTCSHKRVEGDLN